MDKTMSFSTAELNQKLVELYESVYPALMKDLKALPKVSSPMLCQVPHGYAETAVRLFMVGQETRGWGRKGVEGVAALMDFYSETRHPKGRQSPIAQATRQLFRALNPEAPDLTFLWSNLITVDQDGHPPSAEIQKSVCSYRLLPREIAITKPDAVVFFTGSHRNRFIAMFPGVTFEKNVAPLIDRVVHPDLPKSTYYTNHPRWLWQSGHRKVIDDLIRLIRNDRNI